MPEMISLRNYRLSSTLGHTIAFEAGVARDVPAPLVPEALAAGCAMANAADQPFLDDVVKPKFPLEGDIRRSVVYLAVASITDENKTKNFDAGGTPKAAVVSTRAGFDVSANEVQAANRQIKQDRSEGTDPALHPSATQVLRIVEASGSQDLTQIAGEMKVPEATLAKLTTRELRTLLLTKLVGPV